MNENEAEWGGAKKCEVEELTRWHWHKHTMLQNDDTQTRPVDSLAATMVSLCGGAALAARPAVFSWPRSALLWR